MKNMIIAIVAAVSVSACLFSKKEEATTEVPAPAEQAAPAEAAPAAEPAPAE